MKYIICERSYFPAEVGTRDFRRVLDRDDVLTGYGEFDSKKDAIAAFVGEGGLDDVKSFSIIPYVGKVLKSGTIKPVHYFRVMDTEWGKPSWERTVKNYWTIID